MICRSIQINLIVTFDKNRFTKYFTTLKIKFNLAIVKNVYLLLNYFMKDPILFAKQFIVLLKKETFVLKQSPQNIHHITPKTTKNKPYQIQSLLTCTKLSNSIVGTPSILLICFLWGIVIQLAWGQYFGTGTFNKITSIAELTDGYYVIVNSSDQFAMNNTHNGTFLANTSISPSSNTLTNPATSIVWKIETNGSGRTIYNESTVKYVSYTGDSNNVQVVDAVSGNNQRWLFNYINNSFSLANLAVTNRLLQYNSSSPRFACYTGTQQNLLLYKLANIPTLTTPTVTTINTTTATLGATVSSNGGTSISARGTLWGTTLNPTENALPEGGINTGVFLHIRTGFTPNTLYYFRGFATNANGTGYSANGSFTTLHNPPIIGNGSGATSSSITANWLAPTGGGAAFTYEIQLCESTADFTNPIATQTGIASTTTNFQFTGLTDETTYYYRVRINNAGGSSAWSATSEGYATLTNKLSLPAIGTTVTENFNNMGSSNAALLPTGWKMGTDWSTGATATMQAGGTSGTGILASNSQGGFYNFANGVTAFSTDRAIGFLSSGSYSSPRSVLLAFVNNTGTNINKIIVTWNYEKYRSGTRTFDWTFFHGGTSTVNIAAPNGNQSYPADANNDTVYNPPLSIAKEVTISGLNIANGATYYLRWTYTGVGGSTSGQGLAIDDVTITPCNTITSQIIPNP
jgi:hypothetical protein